MVLASFVAATASTRPSVRPHSLSQLSQAITAGCSSQAACRSAADALSLNPPALSGTAMRGSDTIETH